MTTDRFFTTAPLEQQITNRKKDSSQNKVNCMVEYETNPVSRSFPKTLSVRYSHDPMEDWKEVDISKRGRHVPLDEIPQEKLYIVC